MSTQTDSKSLYIKYLDEYGSGPSRPEYFMTFCKKNGVKLRYKECRQIIENPPITPTIHQSLNDNSQSENNDSEGEYNQEELKYTIEHSHNTHSNLSSNHQSQHTHSSSKSITISPRIKQNNFTKFTNRNRQISDPMTFTMNISNNNSHYISPEILINQIIPINCNDNNNDNNQSINIMSYHRDLNIELNINKCQYLLRDFIFFILYWFLLINGFFDLYHFGLWYFRFICFFLWHSILIISLLCHFRFKSPPYYPVYHRGDSKYKPYFNDSAVQYIKNLSSLTPKLMLFHIQTFGGLSESVCNSKQINHKKIEDKSMDIINEISKQKNTLIRLRVYHIIRFNNNESYDKFRELLSDMKSENKRAEQMFHIEYNIEFKQRLLMNTTVSMNHKRNFWNWWNYSCSNRNLSYFWYLMGFGFCYRVYHDLCIKTQVYDCIKEVTL